MLATDPRDEERDYCEIFIWRVRFRSDIGYYWIHGEISLGEVDAIIR
jgi:hypothetical protein